MRLNSGPLASKSYLTLGTYLAYLRAASANTCR